MIARSQLQTARMPLHRSAIYLDAVSWYLAVSATVISQHLAPLKAFAILFVISRVGIALLPPSHVDRQNARCIQAFALCVTMAAMLTVSLLFLANLGSTLGGNDEAKIHFWTMESVESIRNGSPMSAHGDWPGHGIPLIFLNALAGTRLPANGPSVVVFVNKLYSVFWTSWIPVVIYYIVRRRFDERLSCKVAIASCLFPAFLYYGSLGVRDSLVTFNYTLFFCLLASKRSDLWTNAAKVGVLAYTFTLRPESGLFLTSAWFLYEAMLLPARLHGRAALRLGAAATLVCAAIVSLAIFEVDSVANGVQALHAGYQENALDKGRSGSIGNRLRALPEPRATMALSTVGLLGLVPPSSQLASPFIESHSIDGLISAHPVWEYSPGRILKALSPCAWHLCLPFLWLGLKRRRTLLEGYREFVHIVVIALAYLCVISQFTFDVGKMSAAYPLPVALALTAFYTASPAARTRGVMAFLAFEAAIAIAYLYLKAL